MTPPSDKEIVLICDLNVFVMAYIFDSSKMLNEESYSFGKAYIHQTVYDELSEWIHSSAKKKKFGIGLIESMLQKCGDMVMTKPVLAEEEKQKYFRRIARAEEALEENEKSADTSSADKTYLAIAHKINANLATQERTLSNAGRKVIGQKRIFNFSDMIIDRFKATKINKQQVEDGLQNLAYYEEHFVKGTKAQIMEEINN